MTSAPSCADYRLPCQRRDGHARRKYIDLAQLNKAPFAVEAIARIDALFAVERDIVGLSLVERRKARH